MYAPRTTHRANGQRKQRVTLRGALCLCAVLLAATTQATLAAQNDQQPTDFIALPNRTVNIALFAARQTLDGPWQDGVQRAQGDGSANLIALRANWHFSVGEDDQYTIAPLIAISAADTHTNAGLVPPRGGDASGYSDLRLGMAFWFHRDHVNREYRMATLIVSVPTGTYNPKQAVNIGENRTKTVLSLGWMQPIGSSLVLDLVPEVAFFGDNKEFLGTNRLSQDTAYAMSATLRYKATPLIHWYTTAQVNRGGATQRNDILFSRAPDNTRLALGALLVASEKSQVQLRYARDVDIKNGSRNTGELMLRWSTIF